MIKYFKENCRLQIMFYPDKLFGWSVTKDFIFLRYILRVFITCYIRKVIAQARHV
jgi:hypothetical protein